MRLHDATERGAGADFVWMHMAPYDGNFKQTEIDCLAIPNILCLRSMTPSHDPRLDEAIQHYLQSEAPPRVHPKLLLIAMRWNNSKEVSDWFQSSPDANVSGAASALSKRLPDTAQQFLDSLKNEWKHFSNQGIEVCTLGAAGAVRLTNIRSDSGERLPDFVVDIAHKGFCKTAQTVINSLFLLKRSEPQAYPPPYLPPNQSPYPQQQRLQSQGGPSIAGAGSWPPSLQPPDDSGDWLLHHSRSSDPGRCFWVNTHTNEKRWGPRLEAPPPARSVMRQPPPPPPPRLTSPPPPPSTNPFASMKAARSKRFEGEGSHIARAGFELRRQLKIARRSKKSWERR